ncbi:MAG: prepilin-type N-terminal cleavage/methylation domain-containing protein [Magnetococcus sp. YQC-9]
MSHHTDRRSVPRIHSAGFTLIEMIITIVIISIVAGTSVVSLSNGFKAYMTARAIEPMASNGRIVMERLRKEIRNAQSCTGITQPSGSNSIQFINDQGRTVLVNQGASPTNAVYMTFNNDGTQWLLGQNVAANSLQFVRTTCNGAGQAAPIKPGLVTISFTMTSTMPDGSTITLPFKTSVYVRSSPT